MNAGNTVIKPPVGLPPVKALHQHYDQNYTRLAIFAEGGEQNLRAANHSVTFARQVIWTVLGARRGTGRNLKLRRRKGGEQDDAKKDGGLGDKHLQMWGAYVNETRVTGTVPGNSSWVT
jgi:hypothetical protein